MENTHADKHFNQLTQAEAERLALLVKEFGECIQAAGKILRHGYGSAHPESGICNRTLLEMGIGDVLASIALMIHNLDVERKFVEDAASRKLARVMEYPHHAAGDAK